METFEVGDIVKAEVTGIEKYGIFVKVDEKYNGLIHISEISENFVKNVNDFTKIGEKIYCKILEIDNDNNNMKLTIKNINYKNDKKKFNETIKGFSILKDNLDGWIEDKKKQIKKNQQN